MRLLHHPPTPSLLPALGISLQWGIKPSQDQGPLLPLMPNKAIPCYICCWSHGSKSFGGFVSGSSGGSGWLKFLFFLWGSKSLQFLQSFLNFSVWGSVLSPMVDCKLPPLCQVLVELSGDRYIRLLSASTSWHLQFYLALVSVNGTYP